MDTMNRHYFSKTYRGYTLQQTDRGWIIINSPNWCHSGPVTQGPFATDGIARHVVDNFLDDPRERYRSQNRTSSEFQDGGKQLQEILEVISDGEEGFGPLGTLLIIIISIGVIFFVLSGSHSLGEFLDFMLYTVFKIGR